MQTLVGVAGYSATVKGVATRKSLGTTDLTTVYNALSRRIHQLGKMNNLSGVILYLQNPEAGEHDEDSNLL